MSTEMYQILILLGIGLLAGSVSGVLGIGGGIVIIPALVSLLAFTQLKAQGTSLALLLPPIGIFAVMNYYRAGNVDLKAAAIMAFAFIIGSYITSKYIQTVPEVVTKRIFAVFLIIYAGKLLFGK